MAATSFLLDPVLTRAAGAALAVIFIAGAWQKLRDAELFRGAVENYRLLPDAMVGPFSRLLPLWELAAGALLLFPATRAAAGGLALPLLLAVTGAVAVNLLRGRRDFDCGCGGLAAGHVGEQTLGWGLVLRNGVLAAALLLALREDVSRPLVWVDYLSVAGGTLALIGLYIAANQLMANQPRLQALRNA